jgi:two-component system OmpR family response regulator
VSKTQILDQVWGYHFDGDTNIVESYVSYLRRKLSDADSPLIHTVRGVGYILRPPRAPAPDDTEPGASGGAGGGP